MFTAFLYIAAAVLLFLSWRRDRAKTRTALRKAWNSCLGVLPLFFGILICMGLMLSFIDADTLRDTIGSGSGFSGIALSGLIGSITLVPAFAAYPAAAELLRTTGGWAQITMLITTLMLVGLVTLPAEIRFFGVRAAVIRNALGLVYSFFLAVLVGAIYGGL